MTRRLLLVIDTATRHPTLALADPNGGVLAARQWESRHRHGERLLEELDALLGELSAQPDNLAGIVVGTGPGSFTGLRIGLATAKTLAYSLDLPIVGIPTTAALALAAARGTNNPVDVVVTLPAGASDRYIAPFTVHGAGPQETAPASLVAAPVEADDDGGSRLVVAVDFEDGAVPLEASELGRQALAGLAEALAAEGARGLASGATDDVAALVPAYVALPRGIARAAQEMTWSPDLR
jgi:tRNA threonylcarbamoyladenosine biosynthesis protein TsaB